MPCPETSQETARQTAQERLEAAGARQGLSPALVREAQASLASAFALSDLLLGRRA